MFHWCSLISLSHLICYQMPTYIYQFILTIHQKESYTMDIVGQHIPVKVPAKSLYIIQCIFLYYIYILYIYGEGWRLIGIWFDLIFIDNVCHSQCVFFSFFVIKSKSVSVHLSGMDRHGRSFADWICRGHVQKAFGWNHNFVDWFSHICRIHLKCRVSPMVETFFVWVTKTVSISLEAWRFCIWQFFLASTDVVSNNRLQVASSA